MPTVVGQITKGAVFSRIVGATDVNTDITSKTTTYTATTSDDTILCDASSGGFTVDLYTAVGNNGRRLTIKKTDSSSNLVTVDGSGSETIDGSTTKDIRFQNTAMQIISNNTNWSII